MTAATPPNLTNNATTALQSGERTLTEQSVRQSTTTQVVHVTQGGVKTSGEGGIITTLVYPPGPPSVHPKQ